MTVNIESVEIILESETTSRSPGIPVLALNVMSVIQMFEWTGDVSFNLLLMIMHVNIGTFFTLAFYHWKH